MLPTYFSLNVFTALTLWHPLFLHLLRHSLRFLYYPFLFVQTFVLINFYQCWFSLFLCFRVKYLPIYLQLYDPYILWAHLFWCHIYSSLAYFVSCSALFRFFRSFVHRRFVLIQHFILFYKDRVLSYYPTFYFVLSFVQEFFSGIRKNFISCLHIFSPCIIISNPFQKWYESLLTK